VGGAEGLAALASDRRTFLAVLAVGVAGALAGCASDAGAGAAPPATSTDTGTPTPSPTPTEPPLPFPRSAPLPLPAIPKRHPGEPETFTTSPHGPGSTPQVALTIDDGLDPETVAGYVDFAQRTGIPLTFNPNGVYRGIWEPHVETLKPLIECGQVQIGNHTYSHEDLTQMSNGHIRADIERNDEWIEKTFGITARPWFRPPFGFHSPRTDEVVAELGYTRILMWEGSFGDARLLTPRVWLEQAQQWLTAGRIVLGHANHPTVTHLFDRMVTLIKHRHLQPVTLDTMFGTSREVG
jgi:peptidoglycan-N-acetylglucosamine deacetylase